MGPRVLRGLEFEENAFLNTVFRNFEDCKASTACTLDEFEDIALLEEGDYELIYEEDYDFDDL